MRLTDKEQDFAGSQPIPPDIAARFQNSEEQGFATIEEAIADIKAGKFVIVADDEGRENEGDLICAAELITPDMLNFMVTEARGWVCLALTPEKAEQLKLPM